jgi:hypothetical protein
VDYRGIPLTVARKVVFGIKISPSCSPTSDLNLSPILFETVDWEKKPILHSVVNAERAGAPVILAIQPFCE